MRESPRPVTEVSERRAGKLEVRFDGMKSRSLCEASKPVKLMKQGRPRNSLTFLNANGSAFCCTSVQRGTPSSSCCTLVQGEQP